MSEHPDYRPLLADLIARHGGIDRFSPVQREVAATIAGLMCDMRSAGPGDLVRHADAMTKLMVQLPPLGLASPAEPDFAEQYAGLTNAQVGELMGSFCLDFDSVDNLALKRACTFARVVADRISDPAIVTSLTDAITKAARTVRDRLIDIAKAGDLRAIDAVDKMLDDIEDAPELTGDTPDQEAARRSAGVVNRGDAFDPAYEAMMRGDDAPAAPPRAPQPSQPRPTPRRRRTHHRPPPAGISPPTNAGPGRMRPPALPPRQCRPPPRTCRPSMQGSCSAQSVPA